MQAKKLRRHFLSVKSANKATFINRELRERKDGNFFLDARTLAWFKYCNYIITVSIMLLYYYSEYYDIILLQLCILLQYIIFLFFILIFFLIFFILIILLYSNELFLENILRLVKSMYFPS